MAKKKTLTVEMTLEEAVTLWGLLDAKCRRRKAVR
jgi:hypothetical protein